MGWKRKRAHGAKSNNSQKRRRGLGIPDIKVRLAAIHIMWLQKYLAISEKHPDWAWIADRLIFNDINLKAIPRVDAESKISWLKQTWRAKQGLHSSLPKSLKIRAQNSRDL
jgi:hypothetical protein